MYWIKDFSSEPTIKAITYHECLFLKRDAWVIAVFSREKDSFHSDISLFKKGRPWYVLAIERLRLAKALYKSKKKECRRQIADLDRKPSNVLSTLSDKWLEMVQNTIVPPKKVATTKRILHAGLMKAFLVLSTVFLSKEAMIKVFNSYLTIFHRNIS